MRRFGPGGRLFAVFAVLSLVPVLALGALLAVQNRHQAQDRGIAQARAQAEVIARVLGETQLDGRSLTDGLSRTERRRLQAFTSSEGANITRLRLRTATADTSVVFSSDGSKPAGADDEAREALEGEPVAEITRLDADSQGAGAGPRSVEVYTPLRNPRTKAVTGLLEIYLPYEPIAADLDAGLHSLYLALAVGLTLLYVMLAALSGWTTRRLSRHAARYQHLATHDQLTDLPNRELFASLIQQHSTAAVVFLDLDRFHEVNDTLGHRNGDVLLKHLAARLLQAVPDGGVARLGGDGFGLVLADASSLPRVLASLEEEIELAGLPLHPQVSAGVASMPRDGEDPGVLVQRAEIAMYVAKRTHAGIVHYDPDLDHYNEERLALVGELRRAVQRDELVLHYQPQVRRDGDVNTLEALVRWQHPVRGLLPPDEFVPTAEQTGLIDDLTVWVLDAALAQLRIWRETREDLKIAVNISARSLQQPHFPALVLQALERAGAGPDWLLLEITETALITDPARAAAVLEELHAAGLDLSLDDFGQGYTSLSQLSQLPLSELKIDKSFVLNMDSSARDAVIVRSVIDLAHNLGLNVVAEGVEHEQALSALEELGCDITQGYHFSRPLPADQVLPWITSPQGARSTSTSS